MIIFEIDGSLSFKITGGEGLQFNIMKPHYFHTCCSNIHGILYTVLT